MIRKISNKIRYFRKYKGLGITSSSFLSGNGVFEYGSGCGIERDVSIAVNGHLSFGRGVQLRSYSEINADNIWIGSFTRFEKNARIFGQVRVGSFSLVGANFFASSGTHEFKLSPAMLINDQDGMADKKSTQKPIRIGEDCWIGINVFVAPGVTIGKGCVIGANSTVLADLPPYSVAMGQPARTMSKRLAFSPPEELKADVDQIPYFYEGFDNRKESITGCMKALSETLVLCVSPEGKSKVVLDVEGAGKIRIYDREYSLPSSARTRVEADLDPSGNGFIPLRIPRESIAGFKLYGAKCA